MLAPTIAIGATSVKNCDYCYCGVPNISCVNVYYISIV